MFCPQCPQELDELLQGCEAHSSQHQPRTVVGVSPSFWRTRWGVWWTLVVEEGREEEFVRRLFQK